MLVIRTFNVNEEQLHALYKETRVASNGFKEFTPNVLMENSQRVLVFRLILGLSVDKFSEACGRTRGSINNLERTPKFIDNKTASRYMEIVRSKMESNSSIDTSYKHVKSVHESFIRRAINGVKVLSVAELSKFGKKGAKASVKSRKNLKENYYKASRIGIESQPLTSQEEKVANLLGAAGIEFKPHHFISKENVDFFIPDKNVCIGCVRVRNRENLTRHSRRLMYQAYRLKFRSRNIRFVAIIGDVKETLSKQRLPIGAKENLDEICDKWFVDENLEKLTTYLKTVS